MITAQQVKALRDRTGAGMMECKKALTEAEGDVDAAIEILRIRGETKGEGRADREASEGTIGTYIHPGAQIVAVVEVNCETDFVARNSDFTAFARDIAMHVAASKPSVVSRGEVSPEILERELNIFREQARQSGKPEAVLEKIATGKLEKFYQENVLLEQPFVKDPDKTIAQLLSEVGARTGEKVVIRRFTRYEVGA